MSLYLGDQQIAGISTPVQGRVLGQIIQSTIPLTDAGLHLLDGSTITGTGVYSAFYNHMSNGYSSDSIGMKGNVSNNNGVFSNFDSNNYLFIPNAKTADNSEYVFKFTTGSDVTTLQAIAHTENFFSLEISNGNLFTYIRSNNALIHGIQTNTTYWIKSNFSMQDQNIFVRTFYVSTDGVNYTQVYTAGDSYPTMDLNNSYQFTLGINARSHATPFLGSIDIKECYIKQNSTYLWNGADYTVLPNYYTDTIEYERCLENYGACGKFVLDTVNQTIRLPKITGIVEGTVNVSTLGDLIEAGLPNIIGSSTLYAGSDTSDRGVVYNATNAFYNDGSNSGIHYASTGSTKTVANSNFNIDASRSSAIYGNSDTVQPQTIKSYIYIVIATLTKTDIEVDIDEVMTDLNTLQGDVNNKVSKDSLSEVHVVIETYVNGYSWYRIYSDGWCEQGGKFTYSSDGSQTISLLKSIDTSRPIYMSYKLVTNRSAAAYERECNVNSYTSSSLTVYTSTSNGSEAFWTVNGYLS